MSSLKQAALQHDFGIENFLQPESKVLYENIFNTKHIGREIDLFMFEAKTTFVKAKDPVFFEYRFRHVLEHLIFNAWTNYRATDQQRCLEIEVGWDEEKIVLSITWSVDQNLPQIQPNMIPPNATASALRIQRMVEYVQKWSDGVCLRHGARSSRLQVISILQLNVTDDELNARTTPVDVEWVSLNEQTLTSSNEGSATKPEALSTSNIQDFESDQKNSAEAAAMAKEVPVVDLGQTITQGPVVSEDWLTRVTGDEKAEDSTTTVFSKEDEEEKDLQLKDLSTNEEVASMQLKSLLGDVCKGYSQEQLDEMIKAAVHEVRETMGKAMEAALSRQKLAEEGKIALHKEQISALSEKVEKLKEMAANAGVSIPKEVAETPAKEEVVKSGSAQIEVQLNRVMHELKIKDDALKQKDSIMAKTKEAFAQAMKSLEKYKAAEKNSDRGELVAKIVATEKLLSVAQLNSATAQKKADDLMQKWMSESSQRATLHKDIVGKNKQIEDLKHRLDHAVNAKSSNKAEENALKMVESLKGQVRMLQEKLAIANANANRAALQSAADSKRGSSADDAELKHKIGQATKMIRVLKDDVEKYRKKYEELRSNETKMKVEISRLQNLLKNKK